MNTRLHSILLLIIFFVTPFFSSGQIFVSSRSPAQAFSVVQDSFLAPSGVMPGSLQNVTFNGVPGSLAVFAGTSNIGFNNGIILSTDNCNLIPNPATSQLEGPPYLNQYSDPQLQAIATAPVQDAAVLEFDFQPLTDTLKFSYVFASEEYPEFVCSQFNDVFGFFITGPNPGGANYNNYNIAKVPGTNLPVAIGTINPGVPGGGYPASGCQSLANSSLYTANNGSTIIFDGFTHVLQAIVPVKICGTYHIKLAVANVSDEVYNSAVFLEAHSFGGGYVPVQATGGTVAGQDSLFICPGDTVTLCAANSQEYNWGVYGTTQCIQVTQPATVVMLAHDATYACSQMNVPFHVLGSTPYAHINPVGPFTLCAGDSVQLIANHDSAYSWLPGGANTQSIWVSTAGNYSVTVTDTAGCGDTLSNVVNVLSGSASATITPSGSLNICPGSNISLTANPGISYLWSNGATTQSIVVSTANTFSVTVFQTACSATSPNTTTTLANPVANITASGPVTFCQGGSVNLSANTGAGFTYLWSNNSTASSINVNASGNFTVTVTNANGCSAVSTVTAVTVNSAIATITNSGANLICQGDSVQLSANAGSNYLWSNGATTQSIYVSQNGNFTVVVTNPNTCVATSSPENIIVSQPIANITYVGNTTICPNTSIQLNANSGASYLWSNGATTQSITVSAAGGYNVIVTNNDNCHATASLTIGVSNPVATITPAGATTFCNGGNVTLNANNGSSYLWSNGSTAQNISVLQAGNYTVTVTDNWGCAAISIPQNVIVNSATASISLNGDTLLCPNEQVTLTANSGNGYVWSNGATTPFIVVNQNGQYSVVVTNTNGCVATSPPINIVVSNPIAIINYVGNTTICPNATIQLNANNGSSYLWSTNNVTSQAITVGSAGSYTVTVTNSDNCTASTSLNIAVSNPVATITPIGNTIFCDGDNVVLNANNGLSYLWSNGYTTQNITVLQAGNYTVEVTDNWGCAAISLPQNVVVNFATASISLNGDTLLCPNEQVTLTANTGSGYIWSNGATTPFITVSQAGLFNVIVTNTNGCVATSPPVNIIVSQPTASITPQGNTNICPNSSLNIAANNGTAWLWSNGESTQAISVSGNGNYTVTVTNSDNCTAISASLATHQSNPTATITPQGATTFCIGNQVTLLANSGIAFLWSNGATTASISAYNAGNYTVIVTNTDTCTAISAVLPVTVNSASDTAVAHGNTSFCNGDSVLITSSNAVSYNWSNGSTAPFIYASTTGNYFVVITDINGCTAASTAIPVSVHPYPDISFTIDSTRECNTLKVKFINGTIAEPNSTYLWNFGDGHTAFSVSPIHTFDSLGTYNVLLTVNSPYNCKSADSVEILLAGIPEPVAKFSTNPEAGSSLFGSDISFINESQNAVKYYWNFGDNSGASTENPVHAYKDPGVYTIVLESSNEGGCKDYYEVRFPVAPFFIPSAFTPNNDGKNETFPSLTYGFDVQSFEMSIWNRWGMKVFTTNDPMNPFTGKDQSGNKVEAGVYYYRFNMTTGSGKPYKFEGTVNLVR